MDIQSCKISAAKGKSASRSGLAALAEPVRKLGLDARFERPVPEPGSNRGLRPGAYLATFMLMMHEGSRHLSGVAQLREEMPLMELLGIRRLPHDDCTGPMAAATGRGAAHRDLSPAALLQSGQDRAPCPRPGPEAVRRAA